MRTVGSAPPSLQEPPVPRSTLLIMTIGTEGGLLVLAAVLGVLFATPFWHGADFGLAHLATGTLLGLALVPVVIALVDAPIGLTAALRRDVDRLASVFRHTTVSDLLLISILAGAGEEAFFRGFLQPVVADYLGVPAAIALVSVLFGLLHSISLSYVLFTILLGALFGLLAVWADNIVVPMVAHAAYDFAALIYGVRFRRIGGFS